MRRLSLAFITGMVLTLALGLTARAEGPIPDCLFIGSTAGTGVIPSGGEAPICDIAVEDGEHLLKLGWTLGATAVTTVKVAAADDERIDFVLRCAVLAGISQCYTISNVPYEGYENPFELLGPLNAQRQALIRLGAPATVSFTAGAYTHTFTCVGPKQCVRVVLAEGVFGLTVDEGNPVQCLVLPGECAPPPPCPDPPTPWPTPTTEPTVSPTPTAAGDPTVTPSPSPSPTSTETACPTPSPHPTATASPTDPPPSP